jgi:hypothetical protein
MQLSKGDAVAATQARDEYEETEFSFSKEGDAASSLIEAFDDGDVEKVQELVKTQVCAPPSLAACCCRPTPEKHQKSRKSVPPANPPSVLETASFLFDGGDETTQVFTLLENSVARIAAKLPDVCQQVGGDMTGASKGGGRGGGAETAAGGDEEEDDDLC